MAISLSSCEAGSPTQTAAAPEAPFAPEIPVVNPPDPSTCAFGTDRTGFDLDAYFCSWVHQALSLQRDLDADTPLVESFWPATHNSYNALVYFNGPSSNADPNQQVTITEQLWLGFMGVELDFHWVFSASEGTEAPLMCHSTQNYNPVLDRFEHPFCSPNDRHLRVDLREIKNWLDQNPDRIVNIDLEASMGGTTEADRDVVAATIMAELGDTIYLPPQNAGGCTGMPPTLTRNQIRALGKQAFITGSCETEYGVAWRNVIFKTDIRVQSLHKDPEAHYTDYPDCGDANLSQPSPEFTLPYAQYNSHWTRMWEDTTNVGQGSGRPGNMSADHLRFMTRCTLNTPSLDNVTADDPRIDSLVWSWAPGEPGSDITKNCAISQADGFFISADCTASYNFACNNAGTWQISSAAGTWSQGAQTCANEGLGLLGVPATGADNELLKQAKTGAGATTVWLNYSDNGDERNWIPRGQSVP